VKVGTSNQDRTIKCSSVKLNLLHRPYGLLGPEKKQYEGSGRGKM